MFNAVKLLAFVGLLCVVAADVERVSSWGNIAGDRFSNLQVYSRLKSKSSLPWLTREGDVQFPDDFEAAGSDLGIIKGIKHVETTAPGCDAPKAEITKGGIEKNSATVKFTSARGCALETVVSFYVQRPPNADQTFKKEILSN